MNTENQLIELTMTTGAKLIARAASIEDVEGGLTGKLDDGRNFWVAMSNPLDPYMPVGCDFCFHHTTSTM
jgi:hypothetical protein